MNHPHFLDKVKVVDENSIHYQETGRVFNSVMNYYRMVVLDCGCAGKFFLCDLACLGYGDQEGRYPYTSHVPLNTCEKHQKQSNS